MRRKSRRNLSKDEPQKEIRKWKTALYGRLSNWNAGQENEQSLTMQIFYMQEYLKKHPELELMDIYADNGRTGRNFDRPRF